MSQKYKVVPFIGHSRGSLSGADVAQQLESAINQHVADGWEFVQLSDVNIEVQPGCLSGVFGAKVEYVRFDQLIFRSEAGVQSTPTANLDLAVGTPKPIGSSADSSVVTTQQRSDRYQPERLPGGKIKCWKCRAVNDPRQIRCSECDSQLYEHA